MNVLMMSREERGVEVILFIDIPSVAFGSFIPGAGARPLLGATRRTGDTVAGPFELLVHVER